MTTSVRGGRKRALSACVRRWLGLHRRGEQALGEAVGIDVVVGVARYLLAAGAASAAVLATQTTSAFHPSFVMSPKALAFVERHEGVVYHPYQDPAGIPACTGGAGHVIDWRYCTPAQLRQTITPAQVTGWLAADTGAARSCVTGALTAHVTQYQYEALVDLVFNAGCGSLGYRNVAGLINTGRLAEVPAALSRTAVTAGGRYLPGLYQRRLDEGALFAHGYYGAGIGYYLPPKPLTAAQRAERELRARTGFYSWLAWYLHEGAWKKYAVHATVVRPHVPRTVPHGWWLRERRFVKARRR